jgi:hypothetical protein
MPICKAIFFFFSYILIFIYLGCNIFGDMNKQNSSAIYTNAKKKHVGDKTHLQTSNYGSGSARGFGRRVTKKWEEDDVVLKKMDGIYYLAEQGMIWGLGRETWQGVGVQGAPLQGMRKATWKQRRSEEGEGSLGKCKKFPPTIRQGLA